MSARRNPEAVIVKSISVSNRQTTPDKQTAPVIAGLSDTKYNRVLAPTRQKKPVTDYLPIGWDTEFDSDGRLLSTQYAKMVDGKAESTVIYCDALDKNTLLKHVSEFVADGLPPLVVLVSHFAQAELSHLSNVLADFKIRVYNRALEATTDFEFFESEPYVEGESETGKVRLRVLDTFGFLPMSLDKIGKSLGLEKVLLDGVGGKPEAFWKRHMGILMKQHPEEFDHYARRDPEVSLLAWTRLREFALKNYNVDPLHFRTTPGLTLGIFRTLYLQAPVATTTPTPEAYHARDKYGNWHTRYRNIPYLRQDLRPVRDYAMRAYWGGRAEAYGRGLLEDQLSYFDVDSLYPSSATLQPLPNRETEWVMFRDLGDAKGLEGFADVTFRFPDACSYPNLPVPGFKTAKLYFPLSGSTSATLAEVREAQRLGADILSIGGYGFEPEYNEVNHPVREFALEFLRRKREAPAGYERELYKLILNSLIGKFAETEKDAVIGEVLSRIREGVLTWEQVSEFYKSRSQPWRKTPKNVGSGWWIEAASLTLGKARALMSEFVSKGALMTATDSVLLPRQTPVECNALESLRSVGSDLRLECQPDMAWIMRTKVYMLWENSKPAKWARHGIPMEDGNFVRWVEESVQTGSARPFKPRKTHLVSLKEAVQKGKKFGSSEVKATSPSTEWDNKRLLTKPVSLFSEWSSYPPHREMPEKMRGRGRPRKN